MYLLIDEVTLVLNPARRRRGDASVVRFDWRGGPAFTLAATPPSADIPSVPYGTLYYDTRERPCVVPDDIDAAREWDAPLTRGGVD